MKHWMKLGLLLGLALLLSTAALASDGETAATAGGFYLFNVPESVKVIPRASSGGDVRRIRADVDEQAGLETLYSGSDQLAVTLTDVSAGQYLALLTAGDQVPTRETAIYYMAQTAASETVEFNIFPDLRQLTAATKLTLWIMNGDSVAARLSLGWAPDRAEGYVSELLPGDLDGDGEAAADDVSLLLRALVGLETLSEEQRTAADVDGSGDLDITDATMILRYTVGLIDSLGA